PVGLAQHVLEGVAGWNRGEHDVATFVRPDSVFAPSGLGVGEVGAQDVHPEALRSQTRRADVHRFEETHGVSLRPYYLPPLIAYRSTPIFRLSISTADR